MKNVDNYIERLKKECVWGAIASVVALVAMILFIAVSYIQYSDIDQRFALFPPADSKILSFSILHMITNAELIEKMNILFIFYMWIALAYLAIACVYLIYDIVKRILAVRNPKMYALKEYDKIISGQGERKNFFKSFTVSRAVAGAAGMILAAFLLQWILGGYNTSSDEAIIVNSINTSIFAPIVSLIVFALIYIKSVRIKNSVKEDILKEKYLNAETQPTQQDNTEYTQGK